MVPLCAFLKSSPKPQDMFIDFRETGRVREREEGGRERDREGRRETAIGCLPKDLDRRLNPNFLVSGMSLQPTKPPGQGSSVVFLVTGLGLLVLLHGGIQALSENKFRLDKHYPSPFYYTPAYAQITWTN